MGLSRPRGMTVLAVLLHFPQQSQRRLPRGGSSSRRDSDRTRVRLHASKIWDSDEFRAENEGSVSEREFRTSAFSRLYGPNQPILFVVLARFSRKTPSIPAARTYRRVRSCVNTRQGSEGANPFPTRLVRDEQLLILWRVDPV
jgi:hypothetical protein